MIGKLMGARMDLCLIITYKCPTERGEGYWGRHLSCSRLVVAAEDEDDEYPLLILKKFCMGGRLQILFIIITFSILSCFIF